MRCCGSALPVSVTCPARLGCRHPMAFPLGTPALSRSRLPDVGFPPCPRPAPAPPRAAAIAPGPAPMGARQGKQPAGPPFSPQTGCCEGVPSLGFDYLLIFGNCEGRKAPASPPGQLAVPGSAPPGRQGAAACPELCLAAGLLRWGGAGSGVCCFGVCCFFILSGKKKKKGGVRRGRGQGASSLGALVWGGQIRLRRPAWLRSPARASRSVLLALPGGSSLGFGGPPAGIRAACGVWGLLKPTRPPARERCSKRGGGGRGASLPSAPFCGRAVQLAGCKSHPASPRAAACLPAGR